jgi:hypothetical protein
MPYNQVSRKRYRFSMTIDAILEEIRTLSLAERKRLITAIVDTLTEQPLEPARKKRSILEFEGVGAEMWQGIDAQEYVNQLRDEWDERP